MQKKISVSCSFGASGHHRRPKRVEPFLYVKRKLKFYLIYSEHFIVFITSAKQTNKFHFEIELKLTIFVWTKTTSKWTSQHFLVCVAECWALNVEHQMSCLFVWPTNYRVGVLTRNRKKKTRLDLNGHVVRLFSNLKTVFFRAVSTSVI